MRRSNRWAETARRCAGVIRSRAAGDSGSAALEFITAGVLLLVPLTYLVVALGAIQGQALGAEAAARHVARAISTASGPDLADRRADAVLRSVIDEYGLDPSRVRVAITCQPSGGACPQPGATVSVAVATRVSLPLVPPVLGLDRIASVPIEASAVQKVSRFWGSD